MNQIAMREQTLPSMEVAVMVGKRHTDLLRDISRYTSQMGERKIASTDFFTESTYRSVQGKTLPCYQITKKGCEFIAHKMVGAKGTVFTARYINRFHEMEQELAGEIPAGILTAGTVTADMIRCAEIIANCPDDRLPFVLKALSGIRPEQAPIIDAKPALSGAEDAEYGWPSRDGWQYRSTTRSWRN